LIGGIDRIVDTLCGIALVILRHNLVLFRIMIRRRL
jgi:hypothetical protein